MKISAPSLDALLEQVTGENLYAETETGLAKGREVWSDQPPSN